MPSLSSLLVRVFLPSNIVPTLVYKYSMIHYSMVHEPVGIVDSFLQDIRAVSFNWEWPCQFYTIQHTFKCSCYCMVMDVGFLGRSCLNSWYICASVNRQFSFKMSFRQFLISSSIRTFCQFALMIDHLNKRLHEGAIDCASLCKLYYCMFLIRNWSSCYAIDFLLVLMINHCARLKVYLLCLIVQRCNCSSVVIKC